MSVQRVWTAFPDSDLFFSNTLWRQDCECAPRSMHPRGGGTRNEHIHLKSERELLDRVGAACGFNFTHDDHGWGMYAKYAPGRVEGVCECF